MRPVTLLSLFLLHSMTTVTKVFTMPNNETFLYFAYGSNLLQKRLHINNPSAERVTHAKLQGYRLDFAGYSKRWGGAVATIEPDANTEMWGALWRLDNTHMESLDTQEGVQNGVYSPLNVKVLTEDGESLACRTYRYNIREPLVGGSYGNLPETRRPSPLYLETIRRGALESELPESYRTLLSTIPSNGHQAGVTLDEFLDRSALKNKSGRAVRASCTIIASLTMALFAVSALFLRF